MKIYNVRVRERKAGTNLQRPNRSVLGTHIFCVNILDMDSDDVRPATLEDLEKGAVIANELIGTVDTEYNYEPYMFRFFVAAFYAAYQQHDVRSPAEIF